MLLGCADLIREDILVKKQKKKQKQIWWWRLWIILNFRSQPAITYNFIVCWIRQHWLYSIKIKDAKPFSKVLFYYCEKEYQSLIKHQRRIYWLQINALALIKKLNPIFWIAFFKIYFCKLSLTEKTRNILAPIFPFFSSFFSIVGIHVLLSKYFILIYLIRLFRNELIFYFSLVGSAPSGRGMSSHKLSCKMRFESLASNFVHVMGPHFCPHQFSTSFF